jgi:hypothetical protein
LLRVAGFDEALQLAAAGRVGGVCGHVLLDDGAEEPGHDEAGRVVWSRVAGVGEQGAEQAGHPRQVFSYRGAGVPAAQRDPVLEPQPGRVRLAGRSSSPRSASTGSPVEFSSIRIYRIEDGKVVQTWAEVDALGLLGQPRGEAAGR